MFFKPANSDTENGIKKNQKCCILIWKFKIIIIRIHTYLLNVYLVQNVVFIPRCIVKAVQDEISSKNI